MVKLFLVLLWATGCWAARSNIVRPCELSDYNCIGDNLAANSRCIRNVEGYVPREHFVKEYHFDTPYFNSSYIDHNLIVRNLDLCHISEFFYNVANNVAVLGLDCPYFEIESDRVLIQHASLQEDTYFNYYIHATYPLIRITINLPTKIHMDLCKAKVFTDVTALPIFHINPKDKPTSSALSQDLSLLNTFEREAFFYLGDLILKEFVDAMLCKYDCPRKSLPHSSWQTEEKNENININIQKN